MSFSFQPLSGSISSIAFSGIIFPDPRVDWIRESTQEQWPWTSGIPANQLADLLLDHGRYTDAEIIRRSE